MFTKEQQENVARRRMLFVQQMMSIADATPEGLKHMGLKTKEQGLINEVSSYRADIHKICGD